MSDFHWVYQISDIDIVDNENIYVIGRVLEIIRFGDVVYFESDENRTQFEIIEINMWGKPVDECDPVFTPRLTLKGDATQAIKSKHLIAQIESV